MLDQFPRNIHRNSLRAFEFDAKAAAISKELVESKEVEKWDWIYKYFVAMPLMHAEDLQTHDVCIALAAKWLEAAPPQYKEMFTALHKYAGMHRDIIVKFSRYPHRNEWLGRESTPEEVEHLKVHPGF